MNKAITIRARQLYQSILDGTSDNTVLFLVQAAAHIEGFVLQNAFKGIQQRDGPDVQWTARNLIARNIGSAAFEVNASAGRIGSAAIANVVVDTCGDGFNTNDANGFTVVNALVMNCGTAFVGFNHNFFNVSYTVPWNNGQVSSGSGPITLGPGVFQADPRVFTATAESITLPLFPLCNSPLIDAGDPASQFNDVSIPPSFGTARNDIGGYGGPGAAITLSTAVQQSLLQQAGCLPQPPTAFFTLPSGNGPIGTRDHNTQFTLDGGATWEGAYIVAPFPPGFPPYEVIPGTQYVNWNPDITTGPFDAARRYRTRFVLPAGFTQPTLVISVHADNVATIFLNGVQVGGQTFAENANNFANPPELFTITDPLLFQAGTNTIEFDIYNFTGPTAFDYQAVLSFLPAVAPPPP